MYQRSTTHHDRKPARRPATVTFVVACALCVFVTVPSAVQATGSAREVQWEDLMPKAWDPLARLEKLREASDGELGDDSEQAQALMKEYREIGRLAPVVKDLDGQKIRLPGYVVPLDFENTEVSEFLLVPYFGACIHLPPPPANQIVYVKTAGAYPLTSLMDPVWVTGVLRTEAFDNDVGDAGYTMQATIVEPYD